MAVKEKEENIPKQRKGSSSDVSTKARAKSEEESKILYEKARMNLLQINNWKQLAGKLSADFTLTDQFGKEVNRLPLQGDFIKIHLPSSLKGKFEWVRIEAIEEEKKHSHINWLSIRVRPSETPRHQEETEHFFSKDATSSFSVERRGLKVIASVQGRNELPNTEANGWFDKLRNAIIALAAMFGMNKPQWKGLVNGIIKK